MAMEPLSRSEFLRLIALGGAGIAVLGSPERALAALARAEDDLDRAALDGDAAAAHAAAGKILAVARGTSAGTNTKKAVAAIVNADLRINVPIAKQHDSTGLTLAGKNMMGCTSSRQRMHTLGLSQSIAEINARLRPELTVIDAMRILVRNGPSGGSLNDVRVKNTVIACKDWVAADTYATRLFGKKPGAVPYIKAAADMGLGTMDLSSLTIRSV